MRLAAITALILALLPALAGAQSLGITTGDQPIEIEADQGIEWQRGNQLYIARGNARATQGDRKVDADTLTAHYRPTGDGRNQIYRLDADGNVRITSPREIATGDHAVYDVLGSVLVVSGRSVSLKTAEDTVTANQAIEYHEARRYAVARGDAVAVRQDRRVRADVLVGHFVDIPANAGGGSEMRRMEAFGNVRIDTATDIVFADHGDYDLRTGIVRLDGNVRITRADTQLNGERAEVNLETGVSRLLGGGGPGGGRVQGLLVPGQPPPAATVPPTAR
ncbi:MAG: LptA/OstA family protein [Alphaproteobacteria bacterium]